LGGVTASISVGSLRPVASPGVVVSSSASVLASGLSVGLTNQWCIWLSMKPWSRRRAPVDKGQARKKMDPVEKTDRVEKRKNYGNSFIRHDCLIQF
jgi:hypothetical protein